MPQYMLGVRGVTEVSRRQYVPALVTLVALACGLASLEATRMGAFDIALWFIVLAAAADGVDGAVARKMRAAGPMGAQLDSLSDVITFGVAPAFLFATAYAEVPGIIRFGAALAFVGCGAFRLARYNAEPSGAAFSGLPIPAAGALLAALVVGPFASEPRLSELVTVVLAGLMVSRHPFEKFAHYRWAVLPVAGVGVLWLVLWRSGETLAMAIAVTLATYVVWSLVSRLVDEGARGIVDEIRSHVRPRS